jgi:hypothetical protein
MQRKWATGEAGNDYLYYCLALFDDWRKLYKQMCADDACILTQNLKLE